MPTKSIHARLTELLVDVQSRLSEPVDLTSMAKKVGTSPFHFHRVFREYTGETPRQHIERLRLERASLRLALTDDDIADISQAVGFLHHETFSRSFKRRFGKTPNLWRKYSRAKRVNSLQMTTPLSALCHVSDVKCKSLKPGILLAKRRLGEYKKFDNAPFTKTDTLWNPLVRWAERNNLPHEKIGWGLTHDTPGITPAELQRFDACIPIDREVEGTRDFQCLRFDGGPYLVIDHIGPASTIDAAYIRLIHAFNEELGRYIYRDTPMVTIYRKVDTERNSRINHTTVCLPVTQLQQRKKRQKRKRAR